MGDRAGKSRSLCWCRTGEITAGLMWSQTQAHALSWLWEGNWYWVRALRNFDLTAYLIQCKWHCFKFSSSYNDVRAINKKQVRCVRWQTLAGLCLPLSGEAEGLACGVCPVNIPLCVLHSASRVTRSKAVPCAQLNRKASVSQVCSHKKSVGKQSLISVEGRFGFTCLTSALSRS